MNLDVISRRFRYTILCLATICGVLFVIQYSYIGSTYPPPASERSLSDAVTQTKVVNRTDFQVPPLEISEGETSFSDNIDKVGSAGAPDEISYDSNTSIATLSRSRGAAVGSIGHEEGIKTILYWTTRYRKDWSEAWGRGQDIFQRCPYSRCTVTGDRSTLNQSSLLLFFHMDPPNFPEIRYPNQLYAHFTKDPPRTTDQTYLDEYENILNLTGNYRPSADVYSTYATYHPLAVPKKGVYSPRVPFGNRTGSIAWMVSHCLTNSKRHLYVNDLKKYIDVDIYGACGNNSCPKTLGYVH